MNKNHNDALFQIKECSQKGYTDKNSLHLNLLDLTALDDEELLIIEKYAFSVIASDCLISTDAWPCLKAIQSERMKRIMNSQSKQMIALHTVTDRLNSNVELFSADVNAIAATATKESWLQLKVASLIGFLGILIGVLITKYFG